MDQLTLGGIGIFLVLSNYLRSDRSNFGQAPYGPNTADNEMKQALATRDNAKVQKLYPKVSDASLKAKAKEYVLKNCGNCEAMNRDNFEKNALRSFEDKPLTDYIHNNFVPFGNVKQNMAGTGVSTGNYTLSNSGAAGSVNSGFDEKTPYASKLGQYTGRDALKPNKSDAHQPGSMFAPNERNEGNVFGTPLNRPDADRFTNPSGRRHDLKPCESVQVGPGLGLAADVPGRQGLYDTTRVENRDLAATTTRGQENKQIIPGKDYAKSQGPASFASGLLGNLDSSAEGFGQERGDKAFVSKKCNTFVTTENHPLVAGKSHLLGHAEQADHEHRGDTLRGTENTHSAFNSSETESAPVRYNSFITDSHNIKHKTSHTLPVSHGHRTNGMKVNKAYVNETQRGESNERFQLGRSAVNMGTLQVQDTARSTMRQNTVSDAMGNVYNSNGLTQRPGDGARKTQRASENEFYSVGSLAHTGQTSVASYRNAEGTARIHAEDRPAPGRTSRPVDGKQQMGTFHLGRKERENTREQFTSSGTREAKVGQSQNKIRLEERSTRDPLIGRIGNMPYQTTPFDSRGGCKDDKM